MGREPAAKTRLHGHAAQTGRLHDPGKFRLHPAGDGRDVGVALRAAMGHRETAAEAAIGHLQAEAVMQRRRTGEQGAGQRGKGLGIAQAKAEERRAMAVALEQENKAKAQDARAKVILAEAEVPLAMAEAFRNGNLGIMDYYKMKNIMADTQMRETIAKPEKK